MTSIKCLSQFHLSELLEKAAIHLAPAHCALRTVDLMSRMSVDRAVTLLSMTGLTTDFSASEGEPGVLFACPYSSRNRPLIPSGHGKLSKHCLNVMH